MGIVEGLTVILSQHNGGSPSFEQLWAAPSEQAKLDISYREAVNDLETRLKKWLDKSSSHFDLQHDGDDYHLSLILSNRWNSQLYGLLCNKIQDYLVHYILNGWLTTFDGVQFPDYLSQAQQDATDSERILLEQDLSFDAFARGGGSDSAKGQADGGTSTSERMSANDSTKGDGSLAPAVRERNTDNSKVRIKNERMNMSGRFTPRDMCMRPPRKIMEPYDDANLRRWIIELQNRINAQRDIIDNGIVVDAAYVHTDNNFTTEEKTKLRLLQNYDDTEIRELIEDKVDKVTGKQLSTEDFTTEEKNKLGRLETWDVDIRKSESSNFVEIKPFTITFIEDEIRTDGYIDFQQPGILEEGIYEAVVIFMPDEDCWIDNTSFEGVDLSSELPRAVGGIYNEVKFTWCVTAADEDEKEGIIRIYGCRSIQLSTDWKSLIDTKQDFIEDLGTIRQGAAAGATAYQKPVDGIPRTDLADDVQDNLSDAYQGVNEINTKIPAQASSSNQLADKEFVNSSISTATATFRGTYNSIEELEKVTADANDYVFVRETDAAGNTVYNRYKYANDTWTFEYALNNSSFTAAQWAAINSAITSGDVEKLSQLPTKAQLDALLDAKVDKVTGKQLSTEDYTTEEKTKLHLLRNYDDTEIRELIAGKQDTLTFDNTPTQNSDNPVKSGGVYSGLAGKADKVSVESHTFGEDDATALTLSINTIYECSYTNVMLFTLGAPAEGIKNEYCIKFDTGATVPTLTLPSSIIWAEDLELEANMHYVVLISYENGAYYGDWKAYDLPNS